MNNLKEHDLKYSQEDEYDRAPMMIGSWQDKVLNDITLLGRIRNVAYGVVSFKHPSYKSLAIYGICKSSIMFHLVTLWIRYNLLHRVDTKKKCPDTS